MTNNKRLLLTSIVRHADLEHASGFVTVLELKSGKTLMKSPMPESMHRAQDVNPRGGLRGARGISFCDDMLAVANTERILRLDCNWQLCDEVTHPLMGGVHDILADPEGLWVTCTTADLLIRVGWNGELISTWEWRTDDALRSQLGFARLTKVNRSLDYRDPESARTAPGNLVHLNSLSRLGDNILVTFGRVIPPHMYNKLVLNGWLGRLAKFMRVSRSSSRKSGLQPGGLPASSRPGSSFAFVELDQQLQAKLIWQQSGIALPNHNAKMVHDRILYNDTNRNELVSLDPNTSHERRLPIPGNPGFLRGMTLSSSSIFIGSQAPAAIYEVDLEHWQIKNSYPLVNHVGESVYGVAVIPDTFSDPPKRLDLCV